MRKLIIGTMVIFSLLIAEQAICDRPDDGVLTAYRGSVALPDEVAFRVWLGLINGLRDEPELVEVTVAEALGIDLDSRSGPSEVAAFTAEFQDMHLELRRDRAASISSILCSKDLPEKNFDEIIDILNSLEMVKRNVSKDYLSFARESLSSEQRQAFDAYLIQLKKTITYSEADSRTAYDRDPQRDIRTELGQHCSNVKARAQR